MNKRVELLSWSPVAVYNYDVNTNKCELCKNDLINKCTTCLESKECLKTSCSVIQGKCNHVYHAHCLNKWHKNCDSCPKDSLKWVTLYENLEIKTLKM